MNLNYLGLRLSNVNANATKHEAKIQMEDGVRKLSIRIVCFMLVWAGSVLAGLILATPAFSQAKPNIIYINADDLGVMDVGYQADRYHTPNINRLRAQGMLFTNGYAPAANCAPSRACVMSGQLAPRHGVYTVNSSERGKAKHRKLIPTQNKPQLDLENLTMASALHRGGYKTLHLGKWHVGDDPLLQGFDINIGGGKSGGPRGGYFAPFKTGSMKPFDNQYPAGTHRVDIFSDQAVRFMRTNKADPFFINMAFYSVHTKLEPVPEFVDKYRDSEVDAVYASMIEKMDQGIGRILDEVDSLGLSEKTLVVFTSDNGGIRHISNQDPYRAGKGSYFEGGIRVPLLVSWKTQIAPNTTCDVPVSGIDFYPTFLAAAGLPVPEAKLLDGVSLLPLLTEEGSIAERALFWHFPIYLEDYAGANDDSHDPLFRTRPGSIVRMGKWKLHEYFEGGRIELYDLSTDVGEQNNLASSQPEKAAEIHGLLVQWRDKMHVTIPSKPNPKYDAAAEEAAIKKKLKSKR